MNKLKIIPSIIACCILASCGRNTAVQLENVTDEEQVSNSAQETAGREDSLASSNITNSKTVSKGKIESITNIAVYGQMQEQIIKLNIKDGVTVKKGDVIAELDDERLMNQLVQARNSFEQAEYMYEEILVGQGYKKDEFDKVPEYVRSVAKVKSGYNTSKASLEQAERNYAKRMVTAPVSGTVSNLAVHQYDIPQSTTPLCRIFDAGHLKVVFNILENERSRIEVGSRVTVTTVAYVNEVHEATVNLISPTVDDNGMIRIEAKLADATNLIPGMTAFVNL